MMRLMGELKEPNFWFNLFVGNVGMSLTVGIIYCMYYLTFKLTDETMGKR